MIDDATMKTIAAKLIFESLTAEDREKMLTSAIEKTLTPQNNGYGRDNRSDLQRAFDHQVALQAEKLVHDHLLSTEVQARLKVFAVEATEKLLGADFVERLAKKMIEGLWSNE